MASWYGFRDLWVLSSNPKTPDFLLLTAANLLVTVMNFIINSAVVTKRKLDINFELINL